MMLFVVLRSEHLSPGSPLRADPKSGAMSPLAAHLRPLSDPPRRRWSISMIERGDV